MSQKYRALRIISFTYKLFAVIIFIGAILLSVLALITQIQLGIFGYNDPLYRTPPNYALTVVIQLLIIIAGAGLVSLSLFAFAQLIQLLIDLEENTRMTGERLMQMSSRRKRSPQESQASRWEEAQRPLPPPPQSY